MQVWLIILHTIFEMAPISSSWHLTIFGGADISQADVYAAHVPAACVFLCFVMPFGVRMLRNRNWHVLWQWVVCGVVADSITAMIYGIHILLPPIAVSPYIGAGVSIVGLLYITYLSRHSYVALPDPTVSGAAHVGVVQGIALVPGVSRLALTYAMGRYCGWNHNTTFIFSCALVVPLYVAYGAYAFMAGTCMVPGGYSALLLVGGMLCAYAVLWSTYALFERGYAWLYAVYLTIFMIVITCFGYA